MPLGVKRSQAGKDVGEGNSAACLPDWRSNDRHAALLVVLVSKSGESRQSQESGR
jgi:hypothetical protein